ncbi:MAG: hypothetical protein AAB971_03925, partial [Patescibacteria group bacterium]
IQIGTGAAVQTVQLGSLNTTSTTLIQGGTGAGGITLSATGSGSTGIIARNVNDSTAAFQVQRASGNSVLTVDTYNNQVSVDYGQLNVLGLDAVTGSQSGHPAMSTAGGGTLGAGTYYYRVSAYNSNGHAPAIDAWDSSDTIDLTTAASGQNTITWNAVTAANGYYIYRSNDGGTTYYRNSVSGGGTVSAVDNGSNFTWSGTNYNQDRQQNQTSAVYTSLGGGVCFDGLNCEINVATGAADGNLYLNNTTATGEVFVESNGFGYLNSGNGYAQEFYISSDGQALFQNSINSTAAFQVKNLAGTTLIGVDTTTAAPIINLGVTGATALAGTLNVGTSTGAAQITNIGSTHASSTLTLEAGTGASSLLIGNGNTAHGIRIGNGTADNDILLGGTNAGSTVNIEAGTAASAIQIGNGATAHGIRIGTGAAVQTIAIGSTNSTSSLSLLGGSNGISIDTGASGGTIDIGNSGSSPHIINISASSNSGNSVVIEAGTGASAIQIGNGATNHGIQIGTGAAVQTVTIGSTNSTSA